MTANRSALMMAVSEAPARVLALVVAACGRVDEREMAALDELDAFRRLGVSRARFAELAEACVREMGVALCERTWLCAKDIIYIDARADAVRDRDQRLQVCRFAAAVLTADGRVTSDELLVYRHILARWCITDSMVSQTILHDKHVALEVRNPQKTVAAMPAALLTAKHAARNPRDARAR
jgi:hypothetical protein